MTKSNLEMVYFTHSSVKQFIINSSESRNSGRGRDLEAGADGAEAVEESCLLACSSWLVQPAFL